MAVTFLSHRRRLRLLVASTWCAALAMLFTVAGGGTGLSGRALRADDSASLPALNVATFNIRYANPADGLDFWALRKESVAKLLVDHEVDVVGLQEVLHSQLTELKRLMPDFDAFGAGRDDGKTKGEFSPVLYRKSRLELIDGSTRWLSTTPETPGSKSWDAAITRIATRCEFKTRDEGRRFVVYNTHFDHRGEQARLESAKLLRSWINAEKLPVVLTGDFNCRSTDSPIVELTTPREGQRRLFDTRDLAAKSVGPDSTWNGFKQIEAGQRIDFVLVDRAWKVARHEIDERRTPAGRFPSDHLPVIVRGGAKGE